MLTSLSRALGIPSRVTTTFQSAHDTNGDRTISQFFEIDPDDGLFYELDDDEPRLSAAGPIPGRYDSTWGFHVWSENWMGRSDLTGAPRGWSAVDATPQELSQGENQMGPAFLGAVKDNQDACWDSEFVISEVNSLQNIWARPKGSSGPFTLHFEGLFEDFLDDDLTIGKLIVTTTPGCDVSKPDANITCLDDLTASNVYKHPEPSGPGAASNGRSPACPRVRQGGQALRLLETGAASHPVEMEIEGGGSSGGSGGASFVPLSQRTPGGVSTVIDYPLAVVGDAMGKLTITLLNRAAEARTVNFYAEAHAIDNAGQYIIYKQLRSGAIKANLGFHQKKGVVLQPGESRELGFHFPLDPKEMAQIGAKDSAFVQYTCGVAVKGFEGEGPFMGRARRRLREPDGQ